MMDTNTTANAENAEKPRTAAIVSAELTEAKARLVQLSKEQKEAEAKVSQLRQDITELQGSWSGPGKIGRLETELEIIAKREETEKLPKVRVIKGGCTGHVVFAFVKLTPKLIYLRNLANLKDGLWNLDGRTTYGFYDFEGHIHPDDLKAILSGEINKIPLCPHGFRDGVNCLVCDTDGAAEAIGLGNQK